MTITDETRPYEMLIRWGEDGAITGAHVQTLRTVVDGEDVLLARANDPIPVAEAAPAMITAAIAFLTAALPA